MKTLKSINEKKTNTKSISQTDNKTQLCFFLVLIFISFFLFNADLKAQPDKAGINFKISDYGNATAKTDPAVAYNSKDDEYFVVWFDETNKEVRGRIISGSDPASSTSNSFRIDGGYAIDPARPAVAYNSDDNQYFVIWETSGGVSAQYIAGRAYDADGNALDANTLSYYPGWNAKVEYCSDNKQYIVVYVNFSNVLGFWVDANCRSGSSFYFLIGNSKINIKNIDLAKGSDQYFMVVWGAKWDYNNEEYTGIRGNFIHATYKQSSKSFQISWYDGQWYGAKDPAVAFDPDTKKYLVIWRDTRHHQSASDNHSIYGQYVNQATTEQYHQNNFQVVPKGSTFDLKNPDIVFDKAHDSFLASWDQGDIYGQMIQDTILVGSNVPISTAANAQNLPQLVYNSTREEILCVWEDHRFSPSEIYGQRLGITQTITVDKPAAGDVWNAGSTRYIRWHCKNFTDSVRILISYEGYDQKYWLAVDFMKNTANDGTYEWIVPDNPSKNCVIMIVDAADGSPKGYSGVFEITGSTGNTSTGSKVTVLLNDNFTLTFDEVTAAGNTTLETSQTGPEPPESLVVHPSNNPLYYDIKTTAAFTGAVNLTFSYEDAGMTPEMEEDLILMHFGEASSEWTDITTSVDIDQNLIHGVTDQFSVFAVMYVKQSSTGSDLTVTHCDDTGPGSLREAINYANSNPGRDTIRFNIPKGVPGYDADIGVWMIAPQSELPTITESLYIDGFSQQAFMGEDSNPFGPEIWLYGEIAGQGTRGLVSNADGTDVAGLIISCFQNAGLMFYGVDGGSISGCYVGVDFSGNAAVGNEYGIWLTHHTRNIEIAPFDTLKNIVSGNTNGGIVIADTSGNISILGNIIGLNRTGTAVIGNQGQGISVCTACDSVDVYDNWIGGNESGVYIMSSYNSIRNNFIGSHKVNNEVLELGNEFNGINLYGDAHDNLVTENFIRFNGNCGVYIEGANAINNKVSQNHISGNGSGYGIYNTSGGNKELAPPEITEATSSSVTGTAVPNTIVEIYTDPGSEGLMFQGEVNADAGGIFTWNGTIAGTFTNVTAIAIDDDGNTSMFSEAVVIGSTAKDELTVVNCDDSGPGSLRNAIIYANSNPGADTIRFNISKGVTGYDTIAGVWAIELQSQLPTISESLFIDGFSQKEFMGKDVNPLGPEIWLNGEEAGDYAYGLKSTAAGTDIAGLAIGNFHTGIYMEGVDGGNISGCYVGVDFTGDTAAANTYGIVLCYHTRNITIAPYDTFCNVVSGNTHGGIMISDTSDHITVFGNMVGLNRAGLFTIGNENNAGIRIGIECDSVEVFDNLIGGNQSGITIWGSYNTIHDNFIGLNNTNSEILELGNEEGIYLSEGAQHNLITNNFNCFNSIHGVTVNGVNTLYNKISHNQISGNGWGYGIFNYSGGNNELAPPVISAATGSSVTGTAIPNATVEIYTDPKNEGLIFQGEVKADASGNFTWNGTITGTYANVTAIAIDDNGNTSMFSNAVAIDGMVDIEDLHRINDHALSLSFPNPYHQGKAIRFAVPDHCMVTLQIYDITGREVDILVHKTMMSGEYSIAWEGSTDCAAGIYLVTLQAGGSVQTKKLILQK